jgi:hypothetical protein
MTQVLLTWPQLVQGADWAWTQSVYSDATGNDPTDLTGWSAYFAVRLGPADIYPGAALLTASSAVGDITYTGPETNQIHISKLGSAVAAAFVGVPATVSQAWAELVLVSPLGETDSVARGPIELVRRIVVIP